MTHVLNGMQVELEAVRPDGAGQAEEEYRLSVVLLPLRLRIDQNIVTFLQEFFAASEADRGTEESSNAEGVAAVTMINQQPEGAVLVILKTLQLILSTSTVLTVERQHTRTAPILCFVLLPCLKNPKFGV